ncbi:hypothetical protein Zmor_003774 [Zophobas morio]|uniref:Uncharacterized protein n=1 Tax=Zophobas morio TaxID=2755281 RepID=A0AA38HN08_9CUCU|nr:hypothetical protein Zmor_003774 [Zophobas morio]
MPPRYDAYVSSSMYALFLACSLTHRPRGYKRMSRRAQKKSRSGARKAWKRKSGILNLRKSWIAEIWIYIEATVGNDSFIIQSRVECI